MTSALCVCLFFCFQIGGGQNVPHIVAGVAEGVIKESRELRLQPFNEYRKRFNLNPYRSFDEFTGTFLHLVAYNSYQKNII